MPTDRRTKTAPGPRAVRRMTFELSRKRQVGPIDLRANPVYIGLHISVPKGAVFAYKEVRVFGGDQR